ncbi:hypothetical protein J6590_085701 [Homalodisca vitripennis]|nr:hypothetical protein J6590_085701 [Homalodisca vitripennis]
MADNPWQAAIPRRILPLAAWSVMRVMMRKTKYVMDHHSSLPTTLRRLCIVFGEAECLCVHLHLPLPQQVQLFLQSSHVDTLSADGSQLAVEQRVVCLRGERQQWAQYRSLRHTHCDGLSGRRSPHFCDEKCPVLQLLTV